MYLPNLLLLLMSHTHKSSQCINTLFPMCVNKCTMFIHFSFQDVSNDYKKVTREEVELFDQPSYKQKWWMWKQLYMYKVGFVEVMFMDFSWMLIIIVINKVFLLINVNKHLHSCYSGTEWRWPRNPYPR